MDYNSTRKVYYRPLEPPPQMPQDTRHSRYHIEWNSSYQLSMHNQRVLIMEGLEGGIDEWERANYEAMEDTLDMLE